VIIGVHIPEQREDDETLGAVLEQFRGKPVLYIAGPAPNPDAAAGNAHGFRVEEVGFAEAVENGVIDSFLEGVAGAPSP